MHVNFPIIACHEMSTSGDCYFGPPLYRLASETNDYYYYYYYYYYYLVELIYLEILQNLLSRSLVHNIQQTISSLRQGSGL